MTLINTKSIDELPEEPNVSGTMYTVVHNPSAPTGSKERKVLLSNLMSNQFRPWSSSTNYASGEGASYNGKLWLSKQNGNIGHVPVEDSWWTEFSAIVATNWGKIGILPPSGDCDLITESGLYKIISGLPNTPPMAAGHGFVIDTRADSGIVTQLAITFQNVAPYKVSIYARSKYSTTWSTWYRWPDVDEVQDMIAGAAAGIVFKGNITAFTNGALPTNTANGGYTVLTASANGTLIVDGYAVLVNNIVGVKDEADGKKNGYYVVTQVGNGGAPWILTRWITNPAELSFAAASALNGSINGGTTWVQTKSNPVIGTDSLTFGQFPTSPNASNTVKGVAERATSTELDLGTAVGGSGANLFVNPVEALQILSKKGKKFSITPAANITLDLLNGDFVSYGHMRNVTLTAIELTMQNFARGSVFKLYVHKRTAADLVITLKSDQVIRFFKLGDSKITRTVTLSGAADTAFLIEFTRGFYLNEDDVDLYAHGVGTAENIFVIDDNTALVCGLSGTVRRTTDRGLSWSTVKSSSAPVADVKFAGVNGIIAGGDGISAYTLAVSTDSGVNWTDKSIAGISNFILGACEIESANVMYAAGGGGFVWKTTDGGANWSNVKPAGETVQWADMQRMSVDNYYLCGFSGKIYKTTNGGASWTSLNTATIGTTDLYGVHFVDANVGYLIGRAGATGKIFKTTNGGTTWAEVYSETGTFEEIFAIDEDHIIASCGNTAKVLMSNDAGATWQFVTGASTSYAAHGTHRNNLWMLLGPYVAIGLKGEGGVSFKVN